MRFVSRYKVHLFTALVTLAAIATLFGKAEEIASNVEKFTTWTVYAITVSFILLSTSISLCYELASNKNRGLSGDNHLSTKNDLAEKEGVNDVENVPSRQSEALSRITNRLYRPENSPAFDFSSAKYVLRVTLHDKNERG